MAAAGGQVFEVSGQTFAGGAEIATGVTVQGGQFSREVVIAPGGTVSNAQFTGAIVQGGTLEGNNVATNATFTDIALAAGASLTGANIILSGNNENQGRIEGELSLAAGAFLQGGIIQGRLVGEGDAVVDAEIGSGSSLENLIVGAEALVPPDARLGIGVRFETSDNIPPGILFALPPIELQLPENISARVNFGTNVDLRAGVLVDQTEGLLGEMQQLVQGFGISLTQNPVDGSVSVELPGLEGLNFRVAWDIRQSQVLEFEAGISLNRDGSFNLTTTRGQVLRWVPTTSDTAGLVEGVRDFLFVSPGTADFRVNFQDNGNVVIDRSGGQGFFGLRPQFGAVSDPPEEVNVNIPGVTLVGNTLFQVTETEDGIVIVHQFNPTFGDPGGTVNAFSTIGEDFGLEFENFGLDANGEISGTVEGIDITAVPFPTIEPLEDPTVIPETASVLTDDEGNIVWIDGILTIVYGSDSDLAGFQQRFSVYFPPE